MNESETFLSSFNDANGTLLIGQTDGLLSISVTVLDSHQWRCDEMRQSIFKESRNVIGKNKENYDRLQKLWNLF
jgi:hypothetical protein